MLSIFAQSMLTATRGPCVTLRDMPPQNPIKRRRRWFSRAARCVDLSKL